jgi:hypothetical protein
MSHDPCNPIPAYDFPKGLPLHHQQATLHIPSHAPRLPARESHAVTAIAPIYVGCDHHTSASAAGRTNAVHFPPAIEVPATILMPAPTMSVVALTNAAPIVVDPGEDFSVSMPEPSGAAMFLFAMLIVVVARRFNGLHATKPVNRRPAALAVIKGRRRHRCRAIAPYCALQM